VLRLAEVVSYDTAVKRTRYRRKHRRAAGGVLTSLSVMGARDR